MTKGGISIEILSIVDNDTNTRGGLAESTGVAEKKEGHH